MHETKGEANTRLHELQQEREHLETLFADRINFYLVFAAGVLVVLFDPKGPDARMLRFGLGTVIVVSVLMLVALFRTLCLVIMVLNQIIDEFPDAPYSVYHKRLRGIIPNANYFLFCLPLALTVFFCRALFLIWSS